MAVAIQMRPIAANISRFSVVLRILQRINILVDGPERQVMNKLIRHRKPHTSTSGARRRKETELSPSVTQVRTTAQQTDAPSSESLQLVAQRLRRRANAIQIGMTMIASIRSRGRSGRGSLSRTVDLIIAWRNRD